MFVQSSAFGGGAENPAVRPSEATNDRLVLDREVRRKKKRKKPKKKRPPPLSRRRETFIDSIRNTHMYL
jgi:hypothetical protein